MGRDIIKSLSEREQARTKIAIWFGSRDNFMHPLKECIANAIDEINNNFESGEVTVRLEKDGTVAVTDTGRGIPIDGKTEGVPNYELLLLKLFAGTNYDNGSNGKIATGTNGVGLTVTNYCSSYFNVRSYREKIYSIIFENGGKITKPLKDVTNNVDFRGTRIVFKLDTAVFGHYEYDIEEIKTILRSSAGVNSKINFVFQYENEEAIEYNYGSLEEYFCDIASDNTCNSIIGASKLYENEIIN
ncbi:ATP-binding protein, partial [Cetobacterium sp.]|uniref:ATP-binding protein n=1 Tax=Cetobacterium sp. TaxID=2071632 RepID=UPI003EE4766E